MPDPLDLQLESERQHYVWLWAELESSEKRMEELEAQKRERGNVVAFRGRGE